MDPIITAEWLLHADGRPRYLVIAFSGTIKVAAIGSEDFLNLRRKARHQ
jgi:hypothetical protein